MRAALLLPLILLPLALPLPGASGTAHPAASSVTDVSILGFAFDPQVVAVSLGESVRWTNQDAVPHTATSDDGLAFDTGTLGSGASSLQVLRDVGTFPYHCDIHPFMTGKVLVGDASGLADLSVAGIAASDTTPGVVKTVDVTVRNDGTNTAPASTVHLAYLYHGALHAIGDAQVRQLGPLGDTATVSFTWTTAGKVGDFVLDAEADSAGIVPESDETDNHGQATTSVLVGGVDGIDLLQPLE